MDVFRYAERGASLLNAPVGTVEQLQDYLSDRHWLVPSITAKDPRALVRFQRELRPAFEAAETDEVGSVARINTLLDKHPVMPHIASDGPGDWHLHVGNKASTVAQLLVAEALIGLAFLVCDLGPERLGVCQAAGCDSVYVDTSPNTSRRYCSDRCSSRANVAAYRARQKCAPAQAHA